MTHHAPPIFATEELIDTVYVTIENTSNRTFENLNMPAFPIEKKRHYNKSVRRAIDTATA